MVKRTEHKAGIKIFVADSDELQPDQFPRLTNASSAFFYKFVHGPLEPLSPEFALCRIKNLTIEDRWALTNWNLAWEAAQFRQDIFGRTLPDSMRWLLRRPTSNVYLLPYHSADRYGTYAPLFHLLPLRTLREFGLPALKCGTFPADWSGMARADYLPADFQDRLSRAFSSYVWRFLNKRSGFKAFSESDPLRILSQSLDYWLPFTYKMAENRLRTFPRVEIDEAEQEEELYLLKQKCPDNAYVDRPLMGGDIWCGEDESREAMEELVGAADEGGRLSELIEGVRSNRVQDDFSDLWSWEREDFERKLYKKRNRLKVSFVEMKTDVPVHGPESEVHANLLWQHLLSVVNKKDKRVVVCLMNGDTRVGDIRQQLGYRNHSPISKSLARIRIAAKRILADT